MVSNNDNPRWRLLRIAVVVVASWGAGAPAARASCIRPPTRVIWSYPAEGDRSVPLDAEIRVLATTPLINQSQATLNGTVLSPSTDGVYPVEGLDPDTEYTFRIVERRSGPNEPPTIFELTFQTGSALTAAIVAPQLLAATHSVAMPTLESFCDQAYNAGECFDTPPYEYDRLELDHDDAVAWLVALPGTATGKLWPGACSPVLTLPAAADKPTCIDLRALSANGTLSEPVRHCAPAETGSKTLPQDAAEMPASSCSIVAPGQRHSWSSWACMLSLCGLATAISRRRARRMPCSENLVDAEVDAAGR